MTIVGENNTDIMLNPNGQPVADSSGDFKIVSGDACWEQDLRLEALTEPGELFYEDENGDEAYGFGLLDFSHAENDEFTQKEIEQRVKNKLSKRTYLDQRLLNWHVMEQSMLQKYGRQFILEIPECLNKKKKKNVRNFRLIF